MHAEIVSDFFDRTLRISDAYAQEIMEFSLLRSIVTAEQL